MRPGSLAVLGLGDATMMRLATELDSRGVHVADIAAVRLPCPVDGLQLRGGHNSFNAKAASAVALGLPGPDALLPRQAAEGLKSFKPLEHRLEPCGEVGGISFVNDSKATNTDAAIKAVTAFASFSGKKSNKANTIVLFGGADKGAELDDLVAACRNQVRAAVCYGAAGERFFAAMSACGAFQCLLAGTMAEAFASALRLAKAGDTVLLSPACASFDEFGSFEERGDAFKRLVGEYAAAEATAQAGTVLETVVAGHVAH
jgi:UDP-N-acetylmuramoylalanine--D-glutamate ligase